MKNDFARRLAEVEHAAAHASAPGEVSPRAQWFIRQITAEIEGEAAALERYGPAGPEPPGEPARPLSPRALERIDEIASWLDDPDRDPRPTRPRPSWPA